MADVQLVQALMITAELYGRAFSPEAAKLLVADLEGIPVAQVLAALARCRKELRAFPTLADILARISDGRPGPEEAWAMLPKDESSSAVWTEEMAEAFATARGLLATDEVAARMAFREKYAALLADARAARRPARWTASLGHDAKGREAAVTEAVQKGRIGADEARALLPDFGGATGAPRASLALLPGGASSSSGPSEAGLTSLREITDQIAGRADRMTQARHAVHMHRVDHPDADREMTPEELERRRRELLEQARVLEGELGPGQEGGA
jgi:hypothetical protein